MRQVWCAILLFCCNLGFVSPRPTHFLGNNSCDQNRKLPHSLYHINTETLCVMMSHLPDNKLVCYFSWLTGHINSVHKTIQQYSVNNQHKSANSDAQKIFYTLGQQNVIKPKEPVPMSTLTAGFLHRPSTRDMFI